MLTLRDYLRTAYGFDFSRPSSDQHRPYLAFQREEVLPAHQLVWLKYHKPTQGQVKSERDSADLHYCTGGRTDMEDIMKGLSFSRSYRDVLNILGSEPWSSLAKQCEEDWADEREVCFHHGGRRLGRYMTLDESVRELKQHHIAGNVVFNAMVAFIRARDPENADAHVHLPTLEEAAEIAYLSSE